jgi:hypothetical protein
MAKSWRKLPVNYEYQLKNHLVAIEPHRQQID